MSEQVDLNEGDGTGSWVPLIGLMILLLLRWVYYGEGSAPVRTRRWLNLQVTSNSSNVCGSFGSKQLHNLMHRSHSSTPRRLPSFFVFTAIELEKKVGVQR